MKNLLIILFAMMTLGMAAQTSEPFNPLVAAPDIDPAPLATVEEGGNGVLSFNFGMSTGADAPLVARDPLRMTIELKNIAPSNLGNPVASISGSAKQYFTWQYAASTNTFRGTQNQTLPGADGGDIKINFNVTKNTVQSNALNGFSVNVQPAGYMNGTNTTTDDAISSFTYTESMVVCQDMVTNAEICVTDLPYTWSVNGDQFNNGVTGYTVPQNGNDCDFILNLMVINVKAPTIKTFSNRDICVDGTPDFVQVTTEGTTQGASTQYIVTDAGGMIVSLFANATALGLYDFDAAGPSGDYNIYLIAYEDALFDLEVGKSIFDISGDCYDLSQPITVIRRNISECLVCDPEAPVISKKITTPSGL